MTRIINSDYRDRCRSGRPDPYPVHVLKRVDRPTTKINEDDIQRMDERRGGFHRAGLGEFGERLQKEFERRKNSDHAKERGEAKLRFHRAMILLSKLP